MFHTRGVLFEDAFGTEEMREIFSEERFIETFMEVEAALARAEADVGVVPEAAAEEITEKASLEYLDLEEVERNVEEIGLFTMSIIEAWKDGIGDNGEYIHWGATSQDIADTAMLLLCKEGLSAVRRDLESIATVLEDLAEAHAETPMIGRTHQVHAIPITFGLKLATWLDEINRHRERLDQMEERLSVVQFFGATGTLASLGEDGFDVQERFAEELDLEVPNTAWFSSRDRFAELMHVVEMISSTLGKVAKNVLMLNREEIGEVTEHVPEGIIGSSTMPHKKNPVQSERNVGLAAIVRGHAGVMQDVTEGFDQRDAGRWYAEYAVVPEAFTYLGSQLRNAENVLSELTVNPENMERNLRHHDGLVTSEAVMMALAKEVGRQTAHEVVHESAIEALYGDREFPDLLKEDDRVTGVLSESEIDTLTDPTEYTGLAARITERTVERSRQL